MSPRMDPSRSVELRTARESDLPAVLELLGHAKLPVVGVTDSPEHFLVAESDSKVVGVVGLELYGESALLRSAAVEESWRGSGVGRVLVERALDVARERGIEDVYLLTTTAEEYFPRFGFAGVDRESVSPGVKASVEFREACPASAKVMRKCLKESCP